MRSRFPTNRAAHPCIPIARRIIAFCALLCLLILIAVSGPHLVHHLADLHAGHSHADPHKSQSTDCLVLSLMQHTPLVGDFCASFQTSLPIAAQAGDKPQLLTAGIARPTFQARSPPTRFRS
jgi:hypothetical protein